MLFFKSLNLNRKRSSRAPSIKDLLASRSDLKASGRGGPAPENQLSGQLLRSRFSERSSSSGDFRMRSSAPKTRGVSRERQA